MHHVSGSFFLYLSCDPRPAAAWEVTPCPRGRCKLQHVLFVTGRWPGHPGHENCGATAVIVAVENRAVVTSTVAVSVSAFVSLEAAGKVVHWEICSLGQSEYSKVRVWPRVSGGRRSFHYGSCMADLAQPQMLGDTPRPH